MVIHFKLLFIRNIQRIKRNESQLCWQDKKSQNTLTRLIRRLQFIENLITIIVVTIRL